MNLSNQAADEHELKALDTEFLNAILQRDVATLEQILPDDFLSIFPDGRLATKAAELKNAETVELESFSTDELQVYWYGDMVAVLNFRLSLTFRGQTARQVRDSHVYLKRNGRWQMILGQTTPIL